MKTNQMKNRWMNAGRIIAVLALAMGMYGCPAIGDGDKILSSAEKELVGHFYNGSLYSGFWNVYYRGDYKYEEYKHGGSSSFEYYFGANGKFVYAYFGRSSSLGDSDHYMSGNWAVTADNTIRFTNVISSLIDYSGKRGGTYYDKKISDRIEYYCFDTTDKGEIGILLSDYRKALDRNNDPFFGAAGCYDDDGVFHSRMFYRKASE